MARWRKGAAAVAAGLAAPSACYTASELEDETSWPIIPGVNHFTTIVVATSGAGSPSAPSVHPHRAAALPDSHPFASAAATWLRHARCRAWL